MEDIFNTIIDVGIDKKITDIHVQVKNECVILFRINGNLTKYQQLSYEEGVKLINYIRYISNIDINYLIKPQTGSYEYKYKNHTYYLRISSLPGYDMDSIVIRILNSYKKHATFDELTMIKTTRDFLRTVINYNWGLFIVSGPTGAGKSTTLYTLLEEINYLTQKSIVTLEDPIEMKKDFCLQIQINKDSGIDYKSSLRQVLRHDPDVIMIGEIRDSETAKMAITCALTGHLVVTTLHAGTAKSTIKRLSNLGVKNIDIEDVVVGVLCQQMHYFKSKPVVLSEFYDKRNIIQSVCNKEVKYISFEDNRLVLLEQGIEI
ncbi:MAG: ATPase, T2SS/T4P/T4SS family [Thomasclavelia sp.]|nr:ATPase, T2SS/T4P/T4SS family [Thomasclavelia sp.]